VPKIDPTSMLINELAETMNLVKPAEITKGTPKQKPSTLPTVNVTSNDTNGMPFKAQLKKVEVKKVSKEPPKDEITTSIIDFKSRLRKVDDIIQPNSNHDENKMKSDKVMEMKPNTNMKKTEIKIEIVDDKRKSGDGEKSSEGEDDNKRKSTGSINSLKKLWEANAGDQNSQLSPKMASKKNGDSDDGQNNNSNSSSPGNGHHESSMDPPVAKKPAVPLKPSKLIYATPIQQQTTGSKVIENNNHSAMTSQHSTMPASRENILDLMHMVECSLKIPVNLITATQWLQLSDKLNIIQTSCVTYADNESMPIHSKFQFKELVTRVENQSNCLRSAGQKNVQDNEKLLIEVGQSLKQLSNALHR
jgi:abelson tyrosine-protein kinase 1